MGALRIVTSAGTSSTSEMSPAGSALVEITGVKPRSAPWDRRGLWRRGQDLRAFQTREHPVQQEDVEAAGPTCYDPPS
jgi:hypothetical protein